MSDDRLLTAKGVAEQLGISVKSVRRWNDDRQLSRTFPQPVLLPSPSGTRPLLRWRESEIRRFSGLDVA